MSNTPKKQLKVILSLGGSDIFEPSCIVAENKLLKRIAVINVKWVDVGTIRERVVTQVIKEYHASEVTSYLYENTQKIAY